MHPEDTAIKEDARSQEHVYDDKFVKRWADRCYEMFKKEGQEGANKWAKEFFSPDLLVEVNKEIVRRREERK